MKQKNKERLLFTLNSIIIVEFLVLGCLFYQEAQASPFVDFDEYYTIVCTNDEETYFIHPSGVISAARNEDGSIRCFTATDTEGKEHTLCNTPDNKDFCEIDNPLEV